MRVISAWRNLLPVLLLPAWTAAAGSLAWAQPAMSADTPIEQVIVTAPKLPEEIKNFVQSYATRSLAGDGVISRWKNGVCPATFGFADTHDNEFVTLRIRQIAALVGAPVAETPCGINIHVYFSAEPQQLLDGIRGHGGARLLTATPSKSKQIAVINKPIQAWYATGTRTEHDGVLTFDDNDDNGWSGCVCDIGPPANGPGVRVLDFDSNRANLRSELAHVYVIADVKQTSRYRFTAVADFIAMLSLSEIRISSTCQDLPSITYLIVPDCDARLKPDQATDSDLAFLKGIYSVDPGEALRNQQNDIAAEMAKELEGRN